MTSLIKKVELLANVAIVALALLLGTVLVKRYFFDGPKGSVIARESIIKQGTTISIAGYDWSKCERSLVLVLSTSCDFCTESGPFYQRIEKARQNKNALCLVAVLPQPLEDGRAYLEKLGFAADEIRQAPPVSLGVTGTPTLILVDSKGVTINSWVGKLPSSREAEVLKAINL